MDQDEQAWYCSCGFLNEGLDSVCRSCGLSLEEARSEVWRRAQATAREGAAPYAAAPPPDLSAAQVPALGTPGGVIFPFLAGEPRVKAAVLGLAGLRPFLGGAPLMADSRLAGFQIVGIEHHAQDVAKRVNHRSRHKAGLAAFGDRLIHLSAYG